MAEKEVIIGTEDNLITMMYGTSVKESPETNATSTSVSTFDGAVVTGSKEIAYTLEIGKLRYEDKVSHQKLAQKLENMLFEADNITIIDTIKPNGETPFQVVSRYYGCINTGDTYEIKPEDHTVESLKFKCERREREWKDYVEPDGE